MRTVCYCHPVAFMIAGIVVPLRCLSNARTISCLVLGRLKAGPTFLRVAVLFGCVAGTTFLRMLLCDMMESYRLRRHLCRHRRSPTVAISPAGQDPRPIGPASTLTQSRSVCSESPVVSARKCPPTGKFIRHLSLVGMKTAVEPNECANRCLSSHQIAVTCTLLRRPLVRSSQAPSPARTGWCQNDLTPRHMMVRTMGNATKPAFDLAG